VDGISRRTFMQAAGGAACLAAFGGPPRALAWSGQSWDVRTAAWGGRPGPNRWSARNVTVAEGVLRLQIRQAQKGWTCAELQSRRSFGYGRYAFVVDSDLSALDPWVVLGLFTYAGRLPSPHNEIDIEVARWGRTGERSNAQFAVQPFRTRGNLRRVTLPPRPPYTLWWEWTRGRIHWGIADGAGATVATHARRTRLEPAGERVHINLWLAEGHAPAAPLTIELARFTFTSA
jgi:hypothetical protein